jgi:hypothetical protein
MGAGRALGHARHLSASLFQTPICALLLPPSGRFPSISANLSPFVLPPVHDRLDDVWRETGEREDEASLRRLSGDATPGVLRGHVHRSVQCEFAVSIAQIAPGPAHAGEASRWIMESPGVLRQQGAMARG